MSNELVFYIFYIGFGLLIGLATLPWSDKPDIHQGGLISWLAGWTVLWPFGLLFTARACFEAYLHAWHNFSGRRLGNKHRNIDTEISDAIIKMHRTTKDTYFKRRE